MHKLLFFIGLLFFLIISPAQNQAQKLQPDDWREEHAEQKAQFYKMMALNKTAETLNQQFFDIKWYDLDIKIDPTYQSIIGSVELLAKVIKDSMKSVEVDISPHILIDSVRMGTSKLKYIQGLSIVDISLEKAVYQGNYFKLKIFYQRLAEGNSSNAITFQSIGGIPHIWTLSEPFGARDWWPCKDTPSDKADSVDLHITVPENLTVASNGLLKKVEKSGGMKTFYWQERYPIATYLVSLAIYDYDVYSDYYQYSPTDSMEIQFYVFPSHYDLVKENYAKVAGAIEIFSKLFGPYPFLKEKYGHAEFGWGGGMEHQTITSLGGSSLSLIVHELAHQWWGDMITCDNFHHIWLNEGFATYSEALYFEQIGGKEYYFGTMDSDRYIGGGTIYVPDLTNWGRIFNSNLSYRKASWVLHMLRHVVGDSTFFKILKEYYADPRFQYGSAITEDFQEICENVSNMQLHWFFKQWIYGEYYPIYEYFWNTDFQKNQYNLSLTITQTSLSGNLFKMPVDVLIKTEKGDTTVVIWDSLSTQQFSMTLDSKPLQVELDKENWILHLAYLNNKKSVSSFLEQNYPNPLFLAKKSDSNPTISTSIGYQITETTDVKVTVYNLLGQKVKSLVNQRQLPQYYTIRWDGRDDQDQTVAAGMYIYVLETGSIREIKKMLILW
ncbi:T9SS type A sorting domain-containing protein [candidate division KSB1 bacterium]|nr:T9SS type A sorting domain-containing protein [candidate division KSB1 bacterium]